VTETTDLTSPEQTPQLPTSDGIGGSQCTPSHSLFVNAVASPDLDPSTPNVQVVAGTVMQLTGVSKDIRITFTCDSIEIKVPFTWALSFQPPGGSETDITGKLTAGNTLNPTFVAANEGTYRARLTGHGGALGTQTSLVEIDAAPAPAQQVKKTGVITSLTAQDLGTGFGPPTDFIDVEALITLDTAPDEAFGFELRNDRFRPSRQAMFDLLRDAFFNNRAVTIGCSVIPGQQNGVIFEVALSAS
jgi:hypothetical protein